MEVVLASKVERWRSLDYVCAFFAKAAEVVERSSSEAAFVTTKSITQGQQVSVFWPLVLKNLEISFAHRPFNWSNLAASNAGVTCVIIGLRGPDSTQSKILFEDESSKLVPNISPYLTEGDTLFIEKASTPISAVPKMVLGNVLKDDGHLQLSPEEVEVLVASGFENSIRKLVGSTEFVRGTHKYCLYLSKEKSAEKNIPVLVRDKLDKVSTYRAESRAPALRNLASTPTIFYFHLRSGQRHTVVVPRVTSENRDYLPVGFLPAGTLISDRNYGLVDAPTWVVALIASRLHWVWIFACRC